MRDKDRKLLRRRLDVEMRPYRKARASKLQSAGLLRAIRQALRVPLAEITTAMGVNRSGVYDMEEREERGAICLATLSRMAEAMGCEVVYGIVPEGGKTMEELAEERLWSAVLGVPKLNKVERERLAAAGVRSRVSGASREASEQVTAESE